MVFFQTLSSNLQCYHYYEFCVEFCHMSLSRTARLSELPNVNHPRLISRPVNNSSILGYSGINVTRNLLPRYLIGPSGVRALPLAAGINVGGHYKWHFFLLSLLLLLSGLIANSPRRGCRRNSNCCMGS